MKRQAARDLMMKTLFELDVNKSFATTEFNDYFADSDLGEQEGYCKTIFQGVQEQIENIDALISKYSIRWKINRMPKTDLAVLRLATSELLLLSDIPTAVSINEAVELSKKYGTDESPKFVNAILGKIAKEVRSE